jgi:hypothetical protein
MLPAVTSNVVFIPPQQAPLTNTAILGSNVTRVPSDNVPPSVSNAQVDNNAKGNSDSFASASAAINAQVESDATFSLPSGASPTPSVNLPTTFLAQLLGQDIAPDINSVTGSILLAYEKLIVLSNVKYKPSNALKPLPGPAGVFGNLLQQSQAPVVTQQPEPVSENAQPVPQVSAETNVEITVAEESAPEAAAAPVLPAVSQPIILPGISAYLATDVRNSRIGQSTAPDDAVSDLA